MLTLGLPVFASKEGYGSRSFEQGSSTDTPGLYTYVNAITAFKHRHHPALAMCVRDLHQLLCGPAVIVLQECAVPLIEYIFQVGIKSSGDENDVGLEVWRRHRMRPMGALLALV